MRGFSDEAFQRRFRRKAAGHQVQTLRPEAGIGDVLRRDRADAGAHMGAARRNAGRGGLDGDTEHAGFLAAAGDGKGHAGLLQAASGMTAVASISTSHSGRARAETTRPVETGKTP